MTGLTAATDKVVFTHVGALRAKYGSTGVQPAAGRAADHDRQRCAVPEWIEEVTTLEPDGGGGELEWLLAAAFGVASVVFGVLTYRTRRLLVASR